jgi:7,8-dihydropterin-6-yl-methyl-4-(beta-D-ribofuranosyl)aminobenzene 5'-phosphate synthase
VLGGFYLGNTLPLNIVQIMAVLLLMGVQKVGPSHCTGAQAIDAFATDYGEDFIEAGVGRSIVVQP